jgi:hypothetical protein
MEDKRTEWQKRMGVGERQMPPHQALTNSFTEITGTGCIKETIEHADGRRDNFYTVPTQEVGCQQDSQ